MRERERDERERLDEASGHARDAQETVDLQNRSELPRDREPIDGQRGEQVDHEPAGFDVARGDLLGLEDELVVARKGGGAKVDEDVDPALAYTHKQPIRGRHS